MRASLISLLLLSMLLVSASAQADDDVAKKKAAMVLKAKIPIAVRRGLLWLRAKQQDDGSFGSDLDDRPGMPTVPGYTGHRIGRCALALYTLVHCGAGRDDPAVDKGIAFLKKDHPRLLDKRRAHGGGATYSVALTLLFLHALYVAQPLELDENGKPLGDRVTPTKANPHGLPPWARKIVRASVPWLIRTRARNGLFGYPTPQPKYPPGTKVDPEVKKWVIEHGGSDNSNTQFAMLGLWAGYRLGQRVDRIVLVEIAERLLEYQSAKGPEHRRWWEPDIGENPADARYAGPMDHARGFGYSPTTPQRALAVKGRPELIAGTAHLETGSMTAGGLSSLLIVKSMLREQKRANAKLEARLDRAVWDAFAWLDKHYRVDGNPAIVNTTGLPKEMAEVIKNMPVPGMQGYWPVYYLYSLERACMIAGKRHVGAHDWYMDGASAIVGWQVKDGAFVPTPREGDDVEVEQDKFIPDMTQPYMHLPNTCFALLFLERASLRPVGRLIQVDPPAEDK